MLWESNRRHDQERSDGRTLQDFAKGVVFSKLLMTALGQRPKGMPRALRG